MQPGNMGNAHNIVPRMEEGGKCWILASPLLFLCNLSPVHFSLFPIFYMNIKNIR